MDVIGEKAVVPFPGAMKVLIVDQKVVCLRILSCMLQSCGYQVTECEQHKEALKLLRELKFDLVISNVSNVSDSDMDGFELLELVSLEMELPVIIVSSDSSRETIMKAIQHGACDYLIKPIQKKEVEIIWKHVVRRKNSNLGDPESFGILEKNNNESLPRKNDDESGNALRARKKRREPTGEDDEELENGEDQLKKKERFNWNGERHKQFVAAVNQLGINNAVPKKILNALNIPGLKREHVASHLQKYRLGLKKAEKDKQAQHVNSPFGSSLNPIMGPTSIFSFQNLPPRPVTWNNHAPNIISPLHTMPQVGSSMNAPGFLADSHDMLWQVVVSQQPVCHTGMNPLLSNNLMGNGSGTSQPPSHASNNGGFNNNNYNGSLGSRFVQNSYSQAMVGQDRNESPNCNLTCGNSEAILNPNSWDLDKQM